MKEEDDEINLDSIREMVELDKATNNLLEWADYFEMKANVAERLIEEQKLFDDAINEGSLSSLRKAQQRAQGLIEKIIRGDIIGALRRDHTA